MRHAQSHRATQARVVMVFGPSWSADVADFKLFTWPGHWLGGKLRLRTPRVTVTILDSSTTAICLSLEVKIHDVLVELIGPGQARVFPAVDSAFPFTRTFLYLATLKTVGYGVDLFEPGQP